MSARAERGVLSSVSVVFEEEEVARHGGTEQGKDRMRTITVTSFHPVPIARPLRRSPRSPMAVHKHRHFEHCCTAAAEHTPPATAMDHLLEAYASSCSSDDEKIGEKAPEPSVLGELPSELLTIFKDSGETHNKTSVYCKINVTPVSRALLSYRCIYNNCCSTSLVLSLWTFLATHASP